MCALQQSVSTWVLTDICAICFMAYSCPQKSQCRFNRCFFIDCSYCWRHVQMAHLTHDYRFMPQIVSSAMWNCPPPSKLVTLLEQTNRSSKVTRNTQEKMVRAFQVYLTVLYRNCQSDEVFYILNSGMNPMPRDTVPDAGRPDSRCLHDISRVQECTCLKSFTAHALPMESYRSMSGKVQGGHKLVAARNWCLAEEQPYTPELQPRDGSREALWRQKTSGAILYTLRVEDPADQTAPPRAYEAICPLYVCNPLSESPSVPDMLPVLKAYDIGMQLGQGCCSRATVAWGMVPFDRQTWLSPHSSPSFRQGKCTCSTDGQNICPAG